jgi:lipoyl(octanoyl) transferase
MLPKVEVQDLGLLDYKQCWDFQEQLFQATIDQKLINRNTNDHSIIPKNHLLLVEHPHVYTLGKSGDENHLLVNPQFLASIHATYYKINRGGDITYHGPQQLVAYPILDLDQFFTDIHQYLRYLEEAVINTIAHYGIKGERSAGETGVWIDTTIPSKARKICAMGIRASRWVTMHGIALNVNSNLSYFDHIVPCGIQDKAVTSIKKELGHEVDMAEVQQLFLKYFEQQFNCQLLNAIPQN